MSWPVPPHGFLGSQAATSDNDTYRIERSLRFNGNDTAYLARTFGTPTDAKKCTLSLWYKRSNLGGSLSSYGGVIFAANSTNFFSIADNAASGGDELMLWYGNARTLTSTAKFRDPSAWYHLVIAFDSTQATAANRCRVYINGSEITSWSTDARTNITLNSNIVLNTSGISALISGYVVGGVGQFDGYLAEYYFIDGQALTPSSFGETDAITGRWKAKAYSGTYGTNGFYLKFADNSGTTATTLGKDSSPNGNNWTPNNFSVTPGSGNDSLTESPSNYGAISTTLVNDTYQISKSLRFNGSTKYLNRTFGTPTNNKIFTSSLWVKRSGLTGVRQAIFTSGVSTYWGYEFDANNRITIYDSNATPLTTTQVFTDTSAWIHILISVDTTQATASNITKLYINGSQVTSFSASGYPTQNSTPYINQNGVIAYFGLWISAGLYFNGYIAEAYFIDGQALTPTSFGTRDINTYLWKPKAYTGTYGANGFYLNFSDSSNTTATTLGKDQAGSNNWTPNNFSVSAGPGNDSLVDSPTYYGTDTGVGGGVRGNYATLNPLATSGGTLSNGNLEYDGPSVWRAAPSTFLIPSTGKWYFEGTLKAAPASSTFGGAYAGIGVIQPSAVSAWSYNSGTSLYLTDTGHISNYNTGSTTSFTGNASGTVISLAIDRDANTVTFYQNGVSKSVQTIGISSGSDLYAFVGSYSSAHGQFAANFGQRPFIHAAPSGFRALRDYNKLPTPTGGEVRGNYCTLNPLDFSCPGTISNGNLQYVQSTLNARGGRSTMAVSSGKWYWEVTNNGGNNSVGIIRDTGALTSYIGANADGWSYFIDGLKYNNGTGTSYGASYTTNDVIGVALDMDARTLAFYKNGVSQGTAFSGLSGTMSPGFSSSSTSAVSFTVNFGQRPWAYDAPFGFKPLCTTLLPQPIVQKPSSYMDVVTFTANNSTGSVSSLSFTPNLTWVKDRDVVMDHFLHDSIRGYGNSLSSNTTGISAPGGAITSQLSNGFNYAIGNASRWVSWSWKESPIAGMDIVSFTGTGATQNISHSLGVAPRMVIYKCRNTAVTAWVVGHSSTSWNNYLVLNATDAQAASSAAWNNTAPTSSQFTVGGGFTPNTFTYIAYCFAEVEGFSKFGSYTGNGSADGPFVYCGFRPRWVMIKRTDTAANWRMFDTARDTYNVSSAELYPNLTNAESAFSSLDINSNGFKIRTSDPSYNSSGGTYIFAAFAESPFKYARAR